MSKSTTTHTKPKADENAKNTQEGEALKDAAKSEPIALTLQESTTLFALLAKAKASPGATVKPLQEKVDAAKQAWEAAKSELRKTEALLGIKSEDEVSSAPSGKKRGRKPGNTIAADQGPKEHATESQILKELSKEWLAAGTLRKLVGKTAGKSLLTSVATKALLGKGLIVKDHKTTPKGDHIPGSDVYKLA